MNLSPGGRTSIDVGGGNGSGSTSSQDCSRASESVCAGANFEVESIPLDIYLLFDQSGSMSSKVNDAGSRITRMAAVVDAVSHFLHDRESAGISVGIGYFGVQFEVPTAQTGSVDLTQVNVQYAQGSCDFQNSLSARASFF